MVFRGARVELRTRHHLKLRRGDRTTTMPMYGDRRPTEHPPSHRARPRHRREQAGSGREEGDAFLMTEHASLRVIIERDRAGAWIASVPTIPGCHTYGWSIAQASSRIREAHALWDADPRRVEPVFRIARELQVATARARRARERADEALVRARAAMETATRELTAAGCSRRDTAALLGISHQRVQQLLDGG
jgi:predicted RNase H-like HicB family nuclease